MSKNVNLNWLKCSRKMNIILMVCVSLKIALKEQMVTMIVQSENSQFFKMPWALKEVLLQWLD